MRRRIIFSNHVTHCRHSHSRPDFTGARNSAFARQFDDRRRAEIIPALAGGNVDFVLGREVVSYWEDWESALPYVKGDLAPTDERVAWELLRNPLAPAREGPIFRALRQELELDDRRFFVTAQACHRLALAGCENMTIVANDAFTE